MAHLLWGKVYYGSIFAGVLRQEPGDCVSFEYDEAYVQASHPAIAHAMPTSQHRHISYSGLHPFFDNLVANEYLTMQAFKALLPEDFIVDLTIEEIQGLSEPALLIKRFDRRHKERVHFEEFNQLLNRKSNEKYSGAYKEMSDFIGMTPGCLPTENYRLYARILAGILLGNTDMHFKNFALFHTEAGLRLTPSYDQVSAALYQYKTIALGIGNTKNIPIGTLKAKNLITLGREFQLSHEVIHMLFTQLKDHKEAATDAIASAAIGKPALRDKLINYMETRWNGTYALIGQNLSKKQ